MRTQFVRSLVAAACAALIPSFVLANDEADAKDWYVAPANASPAGSDAEGDGTAAKPFLSLTNAIAHAADNDTIHLAAGTHSFAAVSVSGLHVLHQYSVPLERPLKIVGDAGPAETIVNCGALGAFVNNDNAVLEGIALTGNGNSGWQRDGSRIDLRKGVVTNCVVRDVAQQTYIYSIVNITGGRMTGCTLTNCCGSARGMSLGAVVTMSGGLLQKTRITGTTVPKSLDGDALYGTVALTGGVMEDCLVDGNTFKYTYTAQTNPRTAAGVYIKGGVMRNCVIRGNVNDNSKSSKTIGGVCAIGTAAVTNCLIVGNKVKTASGDDCAGGLYVGDSATVSHVTVYDNGAYDVLRGAVQDSGTLTSSIIYSNGGADLKANGGTVSHSLFAEYASVGGTGNYYGDPAFLSTDYSTDDPVKDQALLIGPTSPCVGKGLADDAETDISGFARASATDSGAWQARVEPGAFYASVAKDNPTQVVGSGDKVSFTASFAGEGATELTCYWTLSRALPTAQTTHPAADEHLTLSGLSAGTYTLTLVATNGVGKGCDPAKKEFTVYPRDVYVAVSNENPMWPYDTEERAAVELQDAYDAVYGVSGDCGVVHVLEGTHDKMTLRKIDESVSTCRYLSVLRRPVRIVGEAGAVIKVPNGGNGSYVCGACYLDNDETTVENLEFCNNGSYGTLNATYASGVHVKRGTVMGCTLRNFSHGTYTVAPLILEGGVVTNSIIRNNGSGQRLGNQAGYPVALRGGLLVDCQVYSNTMAPFESGYVKGLVGCAGGSVRRCTIRNNTINTTTYSDTCALYANGGLVENCLVTGNVNNTSASVRSTGGINANAGCVRNCIVSENKAVSTGADSAGGLVVRGTAGVTNLTVVSNTETASEGVQQISVVGGDLVNTLAAGEGTPASVTGGTVSYCCWQGATGVECVDGTPIFKNAAAGDWRLKSRSPGYKAGLYDASWMATGVDFYGEPRTKHTGPKGAVVDIGAAEADWRGTGLQIIVR